MFSDTVRMLPAPWRRRYGLLLFVLFVLFGGVAARLVQLTVWQGDLNRERAERNTIVVESVPAPRGRILDRKGRLIVTNQPVTDLYVVPGEMENPRPEVVELARLSGLKVPELRKKLQEALQKSPLEDLVIKRSLDDKTLVRATPFVEKTRGVYLGARGERRYEYGKVASHLLGYMGAISNEELRELRDQGYNGRDFVGKTGLENYYDEELRGRRGVRYRWVDATGRTLKQELVTPPVPGNDIYLNIDMELQLATEKALRESLQALAVRNGETTGAAAVVFGVKSGEILAMASLPNFDPRHFARGVRRKEYAALLKDKNTPLVDRATQAAFSPGSTFKMVTAMAALDLGLASRGSVFVCGGSYKGAHCFVSSGHGAIGFTEAIALSCDVTFYRLGDYMGISNLAKYARGGGLGSKTGVDLPGEDSGLFPDPAWKKKVWGEEWYGGDTINSAIGQGFILVTPIQMARLTAAVANGGKLFRPRVVDRITTWEGVHAYQNSKEEQSKLPVEPDDLATVRVGMRGAVTHGTSTAMSSCPVHVAGKTGTVESFPNPYNPHGRNHTWFVCFAPYEKPEIAVSVFFQKSDGYGGSVAAPVAKAIVDKYFGKKS